jgi:hypothetical protein
VGIYLAPGADNSFTELALDDRGIYVDKTDFIAEICARLDQPDRILLLALPRRLGS